MLLDARRCPAVFRPPLQEREARALPLHDKGARQDTAVDDIYGLADLSLVMPRYRIPEREHDPRHAFAAVRDELMLDGNSR